MGLFDKLFGSYSSHQIKKITALVDRIEDLDDKYDKMSDAELREQTIVLKARLSAGESLDDILPDAFAVVREADWRVLEKRPFRVQLMGGIILHQGRIAEMKTGEGKTLVATLPAYLNALAGNGVHIVTVNDYLSRIGAEEMGRVYEFLGLTTGLIRHDQSRREKQEAYNADVTYGTNNEYGFDYLRDNLVVYKSQLAQRGHAFAIVDEVDSILIDEARTPLIISGEGDKPTELYEKADKLVRRFRCFKVKEIDTKLQTDDVEMDEEDEAGEDAEGENGEESVSSAGGNSEVERAKADYIVDEKARTAVLTASGIKKAEDFFALKNLADAENNEIAHHINQALKAHGIFRCDVDYMVSDDREVLIVDTFTGRILHGRRYSDGLHQAIEAKEGVKIEKENRTIASITFQNYFRLYKKLSGMTGTALTEDQEFREIYNLDVVEIPTNKPMIRDDHNDVVYRTEDAKIKAIIEQIRECHDKEQPVLVGTVSIEKSEQLARKLKLNGIPHVVLNAKHHAREAEIVALAGIPGKVTIATNMAGRGTDIMLGGNPEFFAKQEMRRREYGEEMIASAVGTSLTVSEEILAARGVYKTLFEEYREKTRPDYEKAVAAGGLFIVGTERHESRRIDNQLRGRAGRQGDPGESRFFISLDDDLLRLFGAGRIERVQSMVGRFGMDDDMSISLKLMSNSIESAQKRLEGEHFQSRRRVLDYDDVMNQQRKIIYAQRREVLDDADLREKIKKMITDGVSDAVDAALVGDERENWNFALLREKYRGLLFGVDELFYESVSPKLKVEDVKTDLTDRALKKYAEKDSFSLSYNGEIRTMRDIERDLLLHFVDLGWMDHLEGMDDLRDSVHLSAYAQRNPLSEYRLQGADMFEAMVADIRDNTVRAVLGFSPQAKVQGRREVARVTGEGMQSDTSSAPKRNVAPTRGAAANAPAAPKASPVRNDIKKVSPNDPCPCGSGKKYKSCHGGRE